MQETGNNTSAALSQRLLIRTAHHSLSFAVIDDTVDGGIIYEPYNIKGGFSLPANLREAFKESKLLLRGYEKVRVLIDSVTLMIPVEEYVQADEDVLFRHVFIGQDDCNIHHQVINELNSVAVFAVNKDLELVLNDHFKDIRIVPLMMPIWLYMHNRNFIGVRRKLFCYFHDGKIDVFCFEKNRFKFVNAFETDYSHDSIYYILYVWKQLGFSTENDELHIIGIIPEQNFLIQAIKKYISKVYFFNSAAELNRAPITRIKDMPVDTMMQFVKH